MGLSFLLIPKPSNMSKFSELFGATLTNKGETVNTDEHLEGKHVMIYFSAHWCPPCRGFTPQLAKFYTDFKESNKVPFEIVFASSDRDESSFNEYYETMPWVALPFSDRDAKDKLSSKFKVSGIPTLVVLDPQGNLITDKGRSKVSSDPTGTDFPWQPKTISEILAGGKLQSKDGEVSTDCLQNKYFGIYFSAHWCPPCKAFTPKLAETYKKLKEAGKEFEIIFASSDRDQESYDEYFASMPWLSLGFKDSRKEELSDACNVEGIPQLTLIGADGKVITHNGRSFVDDDPEGKEFPWVVQPLQKLAYCGDEVNSEPCVIGLFPEGESNEYVDMLKPIAEANKGGEIHFFYSKGNGGLAGRICSLFSIDSSKPCVAFLNIPKGWCTCDATSDAVNALVSSFKDSSIALQPMPSR